VHISYDEKFKTVGDTAATDLIKTLRDWISECKFPYLLGVFGRMQGDFSFWSDLVQAAFITLGDYETAVQTSADTKDFVPPGQIVHPYSIKGRNYEIRAGSLADPKVRSLLERAQIFIPLFIEAGTPLVTDDPEWTLERWTVYFVYANSGRCCV
jgi:histone acetyltransferase 1